MKRGFGGGDVARPDTGNRNQEALKKSDSYRLARELQQGLLKRSVRLIAGIKGEVDNKIAADQVRTYFAPHHLQWLFAASHGFASQLLSKADVEEANRWGRYVQTGSFEKGEDWLDLPGRHAIDGPTGVGK